MITYLDVAENPVGECVPVMLWQIQLLSDSMSKSSHTEPISSFSCVTHSMTNKNEKRHLQHHQRHPVEGAASTRFSDESFSDERFNPWTSWKEGLARFRQERPRRRTSDVPKSASSTSKTNSANTLPIANADWDAMATVLHEEASNFMMNHRAEHTRKNRNEFGHELSGSLNKRTVFPAIANTPDGMRARALYIVWIDRLHHGTTKFMSIGKATKEKESSRSPSFTSARKKSVRGMTLKDRSTAPPATSKPNATEGDGAYARRELETASKTIDMLNEKLGKMQDEDYGSTLRIEELESARELANQQVRHILQKRSRLDLFSSMTGQPSLPSKHPREDLS